MLQIIQLSDIHLYEDMDTIHKNRSPYIQLDKALKHCNVNSLDNTIIVLTGDLVSKPTQKAYKLLSTRLDEEKLPIYVIPGNHDDRDLMKQHLTSHSINHDKVIVSDN